VSYSVFFSSIFFVDLNFGYTVFKSSPWWWIRNVEEHWGSYLLNTWARLFFICELLAIRARWNMACFRFDYMSRTRFVSLFCLGRLNSCHGLSVYIFVYMGCTFYLVLFQKKNYIQTTTKIFPYIFNYLWQSLSKIKIKNHICVNKKNIQGMI
jgi:hypothetical protein